MRFFARLTIHPAKLDGVPVPGSKRGLPTNEVDKTKFIPACGSDSFVYLDGRWRRERQLRYVQEYLHRHRNVRRYAGFEIHQGTIRNSRAIVAYRITGYHELTPEDKSVIWQISGLAGTPMRPTEPVTIQEIPCPK